MKSKKSVSYVEIFIAFAIFLFGVSIITYFFLPFFKPEYRTALDILEKNFENNFIARTSLIKVVVNDTGCIKFDKYDRMQKQNALFFYPNWTPINFSLINSYIILQTTEKEFFLINATTTINSGSQASGCNSPSIAKVYYSPPIEEKFILVENIQQQDYESLKDRLLLGFALDFNVSIFDLDDNLISSIGKPIPKTNVFGREKIYKEINNGKINLVKVRFYVW